MLLLRSPRIQRQPIALNLPISRRHVDVGVVNLVDAQVIGTLQHLGVKVTAGNGLAAGGIPSREPGPTRAKQLIPVFPGRDLPIFPHPADEKGGILKVIKTYARDRQRC